MVGWWLVVGGWWLGVCCVVLEWEQPEPFASKQLLFATAGRTGDGDGLLTVLDARRERPVKWYTAWSAREIGSDLEPTVQRTSFAIRISDVAPRIAASSSIGIGVTSAPRTQLSLIGPSRYAARDTEFVLSSRLRRNLDSQLCTSTNSASTEEALGWNEADTASVDRSETNH